MKTKYELTKFEPVAVRGRSGILLRIRATALGENGEPILTNDCSHCKGSEFPHPTHVHFSERQTLAALLREKNHPDVEGELARFDKASPHVVRHLPKPVVAEIEAISFTPWDGKLTREQYLLRKETKPSGTDDKGNAVHGVIERGFLSENGPEGMTWREWLDHLLSQELRGLGIATEAVHPSPVPALKGPEELRL